jgi:hypothetical protein
MRPHTLQHQRSEPPPAAQVKETHTCTDAAVGDLRTGSRMPRMRALPLPASAEENDLYQQMRGVEKLFFFFFFVFEKRSKFLVPAILWKTLQRGASF